MGNSEPNVNQKLNIYIETQKSFYNSGSDIHGVVFLDAYANLSYDALYIRIQGDQMCQWFEGTSKNRKKYLGGEKFYVDEHMLYRYQNSLQQGKYAYPFALELSQNVPGTFNSTAYDAKIQYSLVVYLASFSKQKQKFCFSIPLIVREPFRQDMYEYEGESVGYPTFCCFEEGRVEMYARFGRNVCFEGEEVPIEISINNKAGDSQIKDIIISLVQYTFVSANNGVCRTYRKVIDKLVQQQIIPRNSLKKHIHIKFPIKQVKNQTAISTLVANYYRLEVVASIGKFFRDQPTIYSPLFLMKKSLASNKGLLNSSGTAGKPKKIKLSDYPNVTKLQKFQAPEFWFKMNRNLEIVNFKFEDGMGNQQSEKLMHRD